ncbi:MAG TPA: PEP/pyruvate-binding domain-containing protein [Candidatus Elarobacter sp.]|jgi:pyruvate,water dikinase
MIASKTPADRGIPSLVERGIVAPAEHGIETLAERGILFPDDSGAVDIAQAGGKAAGLARLRAAGCDVPPWFVVTAECALDDGALHDALTLLSDDRAPCHPELVEGCATTFAVRSSAVVEDGTTASYAGQFASLLFVPRDGVIDAIRRVRASAASDSVRAYAGESKPIAMAVVVQRMVDGGASGVAFGIDPVDGSDVVVVTAAYGLASGVVDGECMTDTWRVTDDGAIATRTIADKDRMHVRAPGTGTLAVAVDAAARARPALDDAAVLAVASLTRRIAKTAGTPQDLEFTFGGGCLWALQARPVTAVGAPAVPGAPGTSAPLAIWDDSNIAESYGGIVGALTYSFARHAYAGAYRAFFRLAGVSRDVVDAHARTFESLVGRIEGRMMYDLVGWYRMMALLPGYRLNRRLMEEMMGVREALPTDLADAIARECRRGRVRDALMLARTVVSLTATAARLPREIARFHAHVEATLAVGSGSWRTLRQAQGDSERGHGDSILIELVREYRRLERALLDRWDVPIANDFFVMLSFGLLKRAAAAWCGDASLAPALIAASGGMLSAEPARAVRELAALDAAGDRLGFDLEFNAYLARFGDRCESELKLESMTLHDDARPLLEAIARLRTAPPEDGHAATALRCDAERRAHIALLRGRPLRAFVFARLTAWARARIVARENLRFERTRVFGRVRRIVVAMGEALAKRGALDEARDVFHLTIDELLGYVEGTSASRDLRALAAVRRAESARYAAAPAPPSRFATRDLPVAPPAARRACDEDGSVRTGTPCCAGVVRARVRVVRDPRATLRHGEILVAERTDPSWVMLFPAAAAILVERGSQLSHAAIVSREMGIPSVVAIRGLTAWLRDGDLVELDGATGVVRRIEAAA